MIVYGDPGFDSPPRELLSGLRTRVAAAGRGEPDRDRLRTLLIEAGEVEEAVADGADRIPGLAAAAEAVQEATDAVADAFTSGNGRVRADALARAAEAIDRARSGMGPEAGAPLRVKTPEGFAFYTLYPEQYSAAAATWAHQHADRSSPVAVVGLRSIGTGLSAVVAATLRAAGWSVSRMTIRPRGHPFDRTAAIDSRAVAGHGPALVVDEGPGLSGSSMAATGAALVRAGIGRDRIAFLPGHAGDPGPAASESTRRWWGSIARRTSDPETEPLFDGRTLPAALGLRTARIAGALGAMPVETMSAGRWRAAVWPDPAAWPAVCAALERTKYRFTPRTGPPILWKFAGLAVGPDGRTGAEVQFAKLQQLAAGGWCPPPLASALGFIATPWISGAVPAASPELFSHIGRYIRAAAEPELTGHPEALARLVDLLRCNTRESLGDAAARRADRLALAAESAPPWSSPGYGDGRMAPHEWVRTPQGRILKLDVGGHDTDHTAIGTQPLIWDGAGAIVEWGLDPSAATAILDAAGIEESRGRALLRFYLAAYAAFRVGVCRLALSALPPEDAEHARQARAESHYTAALRSALRSVSPQPSVTSAVLFTHSTHGP